MKDIPIIFSAPMIRALLDGRKTMTRRLAWGQQFAASDDAVPVASAWKDDGEGFYRRPSAWQRVKPGDRLWVRESWHAAHQSDRCPPRGIPPGSSIVYGADKPPYADIGIVGKLRPGIFLPRWASRLTLIVTATKIERLQDISEEDCLAEGIVSVARNPATKGSLDGCDPKICFQRIWRNLHGNESWEANPWVVAISFDVKKQNIDRLAA